MVSFPASLKYKTNLPKDPVFNALLSISLELIKPFTFTIPCEAGGSCKKETSLLTREGPLYFDIIPAKWNGIISNSELVTWQSIFRRGFFSINLALKSVQQKEELFTRLISDEKVNKLLFSLENLISGDLSKYIIILKREFFHNLKAVYPVEKEVIAPNTMPRICKTVIMSPLGNTSVFSDSNYITRGDSFNTKFSIGKGAKENRR